MEIIEFDLKRVHLARHELMLRLDGALWLTTISKPPDPKKKAMKRQQNKNESNKRCFNYLVHSVSCLSTFEDFFLQTGPTFSTKYLAEDS